MATVTKTTTAVTEGNIYGAGSIHWSDIGDMDTCGVGAGNANGPANGWLYTPICTDFGFALSPTDIITKIEVLITGDQDGTSYLDYCSLMHNGVPTPVHCFSADAVNPLDGSSHTLTFQPVSSGDPDLWGLAWNSAIVNDSTFGCAFDGWHHGGDLINIDCVQIRITYTPGGTPPTSVCDGIPCDQRMDMEDAIKALVTRFNLIPGFNCVGMKIAPTLKLCDSLTDFTKCAERYTLEQVFKSALVNDGCDNWALRVWILPPEGNNR